MALGQASESLDQAPPASTSQNPSSVLVPYVRLDGVWTLPDGVLAAFAQQMIRDRTFSRVFYEGTVRTPDDFVLTMQKPANAPVFAFLDAKPVGVAWLNGMSGPLAFAHFCSLKEAWGHAEDMGRKVLAYWMDLRRSDGEPIFRLLLGVTPSSNRAASRFIRAVGFTELGQIPGAIHDVYRNERVGATLSYYVR